MGRLILFIAFFIIGGIFFKYFAPDLITSRYKSDTAELIEAIDDLPATATRR